MCAHSAASRHGMLIFTCIHMIGARASLSMLDVSWIIAVTEHFTYSTAYHVFKSFTYSSHWHAKLVVSLQQALPTFTTLLAACTILLHWMSFHKITGRSMEYPFNSGRRKFLSRTCRADEQAPSSCCRHGGGESTGRQYVLAELFLRLA